MLLMVSKKRRKLPSLFFLLVSGNHRSFQPFFFRILLFRKPAKPRESWLLIRTMVEKNWKKGLWCPFGFPINKKPAQRGFQLQKYTLIAVDGCEIRFSHHERKPCIVETFLLVVAGQSSSTVGLVFLSFLHGLDLFFCVFRLKKVGNTNWGFSKGCHSLFDGTPLELPLEARARWV